MWEVNWEIDYDFYFQIEKKDGIEIVDWEGKICLILHNIGKLEHY